MPVGTPRLCLTLTPFNLWPFSILARVWADAVEANRHRCNECFCFGFALIDYSSFSCSIFHSRCIYTHSLMLLILVFHEALSGIEADSSHSRRQRLKPTFRGATAMHVAGEFASAASMVAVAAFIRKLLPCASCYQFTPSLTFAFDEVGFLISLILQCGQPTQTKSMSLTWSLILS